jgi:hypothetical protein
MSTTAALETHPSRLDAWSAYAILAVFLAPVLVPPGPGRSALLDPFNVIAMLSFAAAALISRRSIQVPFTVPVMMMSLGSLLATANAVNAPAALFTLIQDAYLFLWFIVMVNVLRDRGDLGSLRAAWVVTGCAVAVWGLVGMVQHGADSAASLLNPKGFRAMGTFDQPDELADYLVMSIFMAVSLTGRAGRLLRWPAIALMLAGIAATKANGGLIALAAGLTTWAIVRLWARGVSPAGWIAAGMMFVSVVLVAVWLVAGLGVGAGALGRVESGSFLGRMGHSSEGREHIWQALGKRYAKSPLGIGPGNSRWQTVTIEERERPIAGKLDTFDSGADPFLSKEAHNDYLAYFIERGPLAFLGMLLLRWQAFRRLLTAGAAGVRGTMAQSGTAGAITAALFGAWTASCVNANTIETLHFRHVWLFLAIICAIDFTPAHAPRVRTARGEPIPALASAVRVPS